MRKSRRVLLVDDEQDAAELTALLLARYGHEVVIAFDGASALALASEHRPHVAILDIGLPSMDGHELGRRIRASPDTADCRLIALTGYCAAVDQERSRLAGFAWHLSKPVNIEMLHQAIVDAEVESAARRARR